MKYLSIGLLAVFAIGCCSGPEGEIHKIEGYVIDWDRELCYSPDHYHVHLTIAENPEKLEKLSGRWWAGDKYGLRGTDGEWAIRYTKFDYYIPKDDTIDIQEGKYYVIRYRVSPRGTSNTIISARKPIKINRRIQATIAKYNNAEKIPVPREIEKIPAPKVKSTEVGSSYFWPTYDAPEQLGIRQFAVTPFRVQAVRVVPTRTVVINNRHSLMFRSNLLFR